MTRRERRRLIRRCIQDLETIPARYWNIYSHVAFGRYSKLSLMRKRVRYMATHPAKE